MKINTGCARITIHTSLIPPVCINEDTTEMIAATGEACNNKLVDLTLTINKEKYAVEAAVADELPISVLLGKDLLLVKLIVNGLTKEQLVAYSSKTTRVEDTESSAHEDSPTSSPEENLAIIIREQAWRQAEAEQQTQREEQEA